MSPANLTQTSWSVVKGNHMVVGQKHVTQNGLPWQMDTWTKTCGFCLGFNFDAYPFLSCGTPGLVVSKGIQKTKETQAMVGSPS